MSGRRDLRTAIALSALVWLSLADRARAQPDDRDDVAESEDDTGEVFESVTQSDSAGWRDDWRLRNTLFVKQYLQRRDGTRVRPGGPDGAVWSSVPGAAVSISVVPSNTAFPVSARTQA